MLITASRVFHVMALLCVAGLATALISQHIFDIQPCAWCVLQRLVLLVIAVVCWLGAQAARLHFARAQRAAAWFAALLGILGMVSAWYQYTVAAKMFSCDQTFADKFMVSSGLDAHIPWLFGIFASCMDARVELLGIEYSLWGLGLFALLTLLGLIAALRRQG